MSTFLLASRPKDNVPYPGTPGSTDMAVFQGSEQVLLAGGLNEGDIKSLRELYKDLQEICARGQERGVRVSTLDNLLVFQYLMRSGRSRWTRSTLGINLGLMHSCWHSVESSTDQRLQRTANSQRVSHLYMEHIKPILRGTTYFVASANNANDLFIRTPLHLTRALEDAKRYKYSLGVKLVRGAYHGQEISQHTKRLAAAAPGVEVEAVPPVWLQKSDTDRCFDESAKALVEQVQRARGFSIGRTTGVGLLFGTHNKQSCQHVLTCMVSSGLAQKDSEGRVLVKPGVEDTICFGQLYGMSYNHDSSLIGNVN